jgi:hypothetical protein
LRDGNDALIRRIVDHFDYNSVTISDREYRVAAAIKYTATTWEAGSAHYVAFIRADLQEMDFYTASDTTLRMNERFPDNLDGITLLCLEQVNFDE